MFMLQSIVLRRLIPITVGASLLLVGQLPAAELSEILKKKVPEGVGDLRALEGVARRDGGLSTNGNRSQALILCHGDCSFIDASSEALQPLHSWHDSW